MSDNPFRLDTVIRLMAEEAEVDTLKTLREMNANWNHLAVNELERSASKLQMKPIDFRRKDNKYVESFLEATKSNTQLFQAFKFSYPGNFSSLEFFNFTDYTPKFIGQDFDRSFKFSVDDIEYLHEFFQVIAPKLEKYEIQVVESEDSSKYPSAGQDEDSSEDEDEEQVPLNLLAKPGEQLMFPKLNKFSLKNHFACGADNSKLITFFKFILDKSVAVDPTPNLIHLEIDSCIEDNFYKTIGLDSLAQTALERWTRLTRLTINIAGSSDVPLTRTLVALGERGMTLEYLDIPIYCPCIMERPHLTLISNNYSHFFHTQAKSLKTLIFQCKFEQMGDATEEELIQAQIHLPIFENLHTFKLKIRSHPGPGNPLAYRIFKMGPFPVHFPKLDTLKTFNQKVLSIMFPENGNSEAIPLRFLKLWVWSEEREDLEGWKDAFGDKFRSVETFKCQGMILADEQDKEIPWKSLRVLEIYEVKSPLNLGYLMNLQEVVVIEHRLPKPNGYLPYFDQVRSINLSAITFKFKWGKLSEDDKAKFINFFPFTVNFVMI